MTDFYSKLTVSEMHEPTVDEATLNIFEKEISIFILEKSI